MGTQMRAAFAPGSACAVRSKTVSSGSLAHTRLRWSGDLAGEYVTGSGECQRLIARMLELRNSSPPRSAPSIGFTRGTQARSRRSAAKSVGRFRTLQTTGRMRPKVGSRRPQQQTSVNQLDWSAAISEERERSATRSVNHLVGAQQKRLRNGNVQRLGGFQIDHQL